MSKLRMNKIEILALLKDSKKIIDILQQFGTVEISESEDIEGLYSMETAPIVNQYEKFLKVSEDTKNILSKYVEKKSSLFESLYPRQELTVKEFLEKSKEADKILNECHDVLDLNDDISEDETEIAKIKTLKDMLTPWLDLDVSIDKTGTEHTSYIVGTLPRQYKKEDLLKEIAEINPELNDFDIEIISSQSNQTCIFAIAYEKESDNLRSALRTIGFSDPTNKLNFIPKEKYNDLELKRLELIEDIENKKEEIKQHSDLYDKLDFASDYFIINRDKYEAISKLLMTDNVFAISGYVPRQDAEKVVTKLENNFDIAIDISDPADDDENVPVKFKNNKFVAPVETITEMYSMPSREDIDPNPVMAFFYYFFFGMMLSDAGYGLLMVIATAFAILKFKPEEKMRNTLRMFMYCGLSTMFWGAMYGSWFGDIVPVVMTNFLGMSPPRMYIWMDPVNNLMQLLMYCFLFGLVHLFVGLGANSYKLWKQGEKFDALCECIPTYLFIAGVAPLCAGMLTNIPDIVKSVGKIMALVGVALIILTAGRKSKGVLGKLGGGLYAVYNIASGFLGDVLSYSRLLALGLATGIIGQTINLLGTIPQNKPVKAILLSIVFVFGHAVNLGINAIGAYVHTNRLQYVELFSKFYKGGGKPFEPFKANTKHFRFKEEQNNG